MEMEGFKEGGPSRKRVKTGDLLSPEVDGILISTLCHGLCDIFGLTRNQEKKSEPPLPYTHSSMLDHLFLIYCQCSCSATPVPVPKSATHWPSSPSPISSVLLVLCFYSHKNGQNASPQTPKKAKHRALKAPQLCKL